MEACPQQVMKVAAPLSLDHRIAIRAVHWPSPRRLTGSSGGT